MDDSQQSFHTLSCTENEGGFEDAIFDMRNHYTTGSVSDGDDDDDDDEYVEMLLDQEVNFGFKRDESLVYCDWIKHARLETIDWTLKSREGFGFHVQTAYLSLTYFDRFLSIRSINNDKLWPVRLLSVACLSLAAKMEESKVPALSEFRVGDFAFESNVIRKMELLVLDTLQWKMVSVTPFDFLPYLARNMCKGCTSSGMLSRTLRNILAVMRETSYTNFRPSAVAGGAILMVFEQRLTKEELQSKLNISRNIDEVFSCYNVMQNLEMEELISTPNSLNSPDMSSCSFKPNADVLDNSSAASDVSYKRGSLTFNDHDQDYNSPAAKRGSLK